MKKRFGRMRKKPENFEIDITSLLDILVILLVFLLKSYNPSDLTVDLVDSLELPDSRSEDLGSSNVMIQVNKNKEVFINNNRIGSLNGQRGEQVSFLYEKLVELKKQEDAKLDNVIDRDPSSLTSVEALKRKNAKKVNIVLDQGLSYQIMRKIMHTSTMAGFPEFKFIVKGSHQ
ncbi:MAG: biopolymer transporter ExbD [Bacteriovoracaceae bacterium]